MNKVELTKDRQEMAIYVFTLVTVVFLPLSAVASIFGINTADIRDMELTQVSQEKTLERGERNGDCGAKEKKRKTKKEINKCLKKVGLLGRRHTPHRRRHRAGIMVDGRAGQHV